MSKLTSGQRTARLQVGPAKESGQREFTAALSSEEIARQPFGLELLRHEESSVDMSRAASGLPLLFSHDRSQPIGRVKNIRLDHAERKLRGDLVFSPHSALGQQVENEVADGFLGDVSISYEINDYEVDDSGDREIYRITQWSPLEASIVSVPADASVGVGRHKTEVKEMPDENRPGTGNTDAGKVVDFSSARDAGLREGEAAGAKRERERVSEIETLFSSINRSGAEFDTLRRDAIASGKPLEAVQRELLSLLAGTAPEPIDTARPDTADRGGPDVQPGADQLDKFAEGAQRSLEFRGGLIEKDADARREMRENQFAGYTLVELARESLHAMGVRTGGLDRVGVVRMAFRPDLANGRRDLVGHSTSVFTNLLENIANKALLRGYDETPETWAQWCRVGNLADFKQASRTGLSQFDDLDEVVENAEYKHGTFDDRKEPIQLATYGKLFAVTRQAIVNDDLDGMTVVPRRMGRAASRKIGDLAYGILTANAALNQDSVTLFHASHSNLGTAGAPSVTTISEARQLMALQTDQNNQAAGLNIRPAYILVPVALEDSARVIVASERDPSEGSTTSFNAPNPIRNIATVVADPRLDADDAAQWYMAADPNVTDTVEVAFLNGNQEPALESRDGWTTDGIEYKVRLDAAAAALDFRGLVRNAGD